MSDFETMHESATPEPSRGPQHMRGPFAGHASLMANTHGAPTVVQSMLSVEVAGGTFLKGDSGEAGQMWSVSHAETIGTAHGQV